MHWIQVGSRRFLRLASSRLRVHADAHNHHADGHQRESRRHCTAPSKLIEPWPAGPFHSSAMCQAPAMPNSAVASYRPAVNVRCTWRLDDITIPGMDMLPLALTMPTSMRRPSLVRNSKLKV